MNAYPAFERDGFFLYNAVELSKLWPSSYLIPTAERRYAIKPGQLVKLSFRFAHPDDDVEDYDTERMWVIVREPFEDHWLGVLDNDPTFNDAVASGAVIHFHPDHIIDIWQDN